MPDMLDKLFGIEQHYEEINRLMMEVGDDYQRAAELNKERIDLEPIVSRAKEYRQALERMEEARSLLDGDDTDMSMLAEAEDSRLEPRIDQLEGEIKACFCPETADERNVIMEIRAGTAVMKPQSLPQISSGCMHIMLKPVDGRLKCFHPMRLASAAIKRSSSW
jgi:protein subunit release factor A